MRIIGMILPVSWLVAMSAATAAIIKYQLAKKPVRRRHRTRIFYR
jgi:hypothetical protein